MDNNSSIKLTEDHNVFICDNSKILKKKVCDLNIGDKLISSDDPIYVGQFSLILGTLLGDGSVSIARYDKSRSKVSNVKQYKQGNYRLNISQALCHKRYVEFKENVLHNIVAGGIRNNKQHEDSYGRFMSRFNTIPHRSISDIVDLLYVDGRKTISRKVLDLIDSSALAVWFCDDGHIGKTRNGSVSHGTLSTHSFSLKENELIAEWLSEKYNIEVIIKEDKRCNKFYLYFRKQEVLKLVNNIVDYCIPMFAYKFASIDIELERLGRNLDFFYNKNKICDFYTNSIMGIKDLNSKRKNCFDIQVENSNHNYFAGYLLISNCVRRYVEECQFFPKTAWDKLQPAVSPRGCKDMVVGVCDGRVDSVYRNIYDNMKQYQRLRYTSFYEPTYNLKLDDGYAIMYGGRDSDEYKQSILGEWGSPSWSAWDINAVIQCTKQGSKMTEVEITKDDYARDAEAGYGFITINKLQKPMSDQMVILGIDIGLGEPTMILPFVEVTKDVFQLATVIEVDGKIIPEEQTEIIDWVADFYNATLIGVDTTEGAGVSIVSNLQNPKTAKYNYKGYDKRIVRCGFNEKMIIDYKEEENKQNSLSKAEIVEVKEYVKDYTHYICHNFFAQGKFEVFHCTKMIADFEKEKKVRGGERVRIKTPSNVHIPDAFRCFAKAWFDRYGNTNKPAFKVQKQKFVFPLWGKGVNIFGRKGQANK